jgi:hypothetical protein
MTTKHALLFVFLSGCCGPEPAPPDPGLSPPELALKEIRGTLSAKTARIRIQGEWPHAIARMPRSVSGTVLLGEGGRAKVSLKAMYAGGGFELYEAVFDGTRLWRSPRVEAAKFNPGPSGLRHHLLFALAWHGVGWAFPQGPHPKTLGEGYVICDLLPQVRDASPSRFERPDAISHECPGVEYRLRLTFDPSTHLLRKRELIGDRGVLWYVESYPEVIFNPVIPEEEFRIPG